MKNVTKEDLKFIEQTALQLRTYLADPEKFKAVLEEIDRLVFEDGEV